MSALPITPPKTPSLSEVATRQVILFGFGKEGQSTYRFLRRHFPKKELLIVDDAELTQLPANAQNLLQDDSQAQYFHTEHLPTSEQPVLIFKAPGISLHHPQLKQWKDAGARFSSNSELLFELLKTLPANPVSIGVTGTKGKSTTTKLIHHVLSTAGVPAWLGGNIGFPPLDIWQELSVHPALVSPTSSLDVSKPQLSANTPTVILELSAHQLADLEHSPSIAVLQNITPEHLDYYASFEEYVSAKARLVEFQTEQDLVIFNPTFPVPTQVARRSRASKLTFGLMSQQVANTLDCYATETEIVCHNESVLPISDIPLTGDHNILNVLPAIAIAKFYGLSNAKIRTAVHSFVPLPHRLELIREVSGVRYYNDSLATTPESATAALQSFAGTPTILIAGGTDRNLEFTELGKTIASQTVRALITFPVTGTQIAQQAQAAGYAGLVLPANSMQEAVRLATSHAQSGDVVLLSPGSASFTLFRDYADRGEQFIQEVKHL